MRCAALHYPWVYTTCFGLGQSSELVPGSTNIPARPIAPSPLYPACDCPALKSPSLFSKLTQCRHKQEHPCLASEQALGCPGAELHLLLMLQKPPGCSPCLHVLQSIWLCGAQVMSQAGARSACAGSSLPSLLLLRAGERRKQAADGQGSLGTVRQPQGQCQVPQQLPLAWPFQQQVSQVCWWGFLSGCGLTLPLPGHPPGPPATAVVAVTPLLPHPTPPQG